MTDQYELCAGIEVHCELGTETKIFCSCPTSFGAEPNTLVCPVCMGLPGTLPVLNEKAVELAVRAALALGSSVMKCSAFDRKNYFYPDLPKGYQITQFFHPIARGGSVKIKVGEKEKSIGITRIHLEEDAGKLTHTESETLVDLNRCGIPLIEIVSEPDLRSSDEAVAFLKNLRLMLIYAGVSECRMNEGNFRADINISVRRKGETTLGTRTEIKNLNSFNFVRRAMDFEFSRQVSLIENGGSVERETMRFDESSGRTYSMRNKESAEDYRYFPEPDLPVLTLTDNYIESIRRALTRLPDERMKVYTEEYGISPSSAEVILSSVRLSDYFDEAVIDTKNKRICSNILLSEILSLETVEFEGRIKPSRLSELSNLFSKSEISSATLKKLVKRLYERDFDVTVALDTEGLRQINNEEKIKEFFESAVFENEKAVSDIRNGKRAAIKTIMGCAMKKSGGRANPEILARLCDSEFKD